MEGIEEVVLKAYKAKDGYEYPTIEEAKKANDRWEYEKDFTVDDVLKEIEYHRKRGNQTIWNLTRRHAGSSWILELTGKYDKYTEVAINVHAIPLAAFNLFDIEQFGEYYDDRTALLFKTVIEKKDCLAAFNILSLRSDNEYEHFEYWKTNINE
jgi:hypothetical protein